MTAQSNITPESIVNDLRYLQLLSPKFSYYCRCKYGNNQSGGYLEPA